MRFLTGLGYIGIFLFMAWIIQFTAIDMGYNIPMPSIDTIYLLSGILMLCAFIEPQYQMITMTSLFEDEE